MQRRRRRRRRLPCALRLREYIRQFIAFMFSNVGVIGLVVAYMIAGAFIFQAIEGSSEIERVQSMARQRQQAVERLWLNATMPLNVFDERLWKYNVSAELRKYQKIIVQAVRKGWDGSDNTDFYRQWSFPGSFLYSLTIITTIGYGNIAPRTDWGKVTTICYAMLGLPLFLLYLTNLGDVLARSFKWFYVNVCLCRGCPGVAKRRATRLRMQIQAQLGEPLDSQRHADDRRKSAPEYRSRQRSSGLEGGGALNGRYQSTVPRGASEPCYTRRCDVELQQLTRETYPLRNPVEKYQKRRNEDQGMYYLENRRDMTQYFNDRRLRRESGNQNYYEDRLNRNVHERYKREREFPFNERNVIRNDTGRYERHNEMYGEKYDERFHKCDRYRKSGQRTDFNDRRNGKERVRKNQIDNHVHCRQNKLNLDQKDFWHRSNNLAKQDIFHNEIMGDVIIDPMDNYGKFDDYERDETIESDEFTYITIDSQNVSVPLTICVFVMVGYIIFGAMLFSMWEDWDRVDGSYFCFISLTSIGFGDIVPGERIYARATKNENIKNIDTSFILCSMYLLFGMALIAMCFNLMQEQVVQYMAGVRRVLRRICSCKCR